MTTRAWLVVPLLAAMLVATSCAETRKKEVTDVVTQYLQQEKMGDYQHQYGLYDTRSASTLPLPIGAMTSPFQPRELWSYKVKEVTIEGGTAQAQAEVVFQIAQMTGFQPVYERHQLTIYLVHEAGGWKVDEIKTRTQALDAVAGPGAGDLWLALQKQKRPQ
ncbi:MAG TPA: hypothetical protein VM221_01685 [Armatimonadota bacterium]|nr:hypothetical protein [Armatimonadota bacterium]